VDRSSEAYHAWEHEQATQQRDLFEGRSLRDAGLSLVESHEKDYIEAARRAAYLLWRGRREPISINDVSQRVPRPSDVHPNATGAIFKAKGWEPVGFTLATHKEGHARMVRTWTFQEATE